MEALAAAVIQGLRRGEVSTGDLERAGDPDPAQAALAFRRAAEDRELGAALELWVPDLLCTARPGFAAQSLMDLARSARERGAPLDLTRTPRLPRLLGCSDFLARLLLRTPEWLVELAGELPAPPDPEPVAADWGAIRRAKYRGLLRIAARDLAGRLFAESLTELSDLADRCLGAGLDCASEETGAPTPALLALGKLGGRELNFSSDVDLLFVSDPTGAPDDHNKEVSRLIRRLKKQLEEPSPDGFVYRVDLDLRPEGPTGVLVNSIDAALGYYESYGAEWERQMLIRLRGVAGPEETADAFAKGIEPFVYRRLIDPGVLEAVRSMKARIENERLQAGRDLEADLKEGPGGIRDVEFLVQSLQLFYGGRDGSLRTGNVLEALERLGQLGLLPESAVASLVDSYTWLRRAEHALQLAEERQTSSFPRDPAGQTGLARRLGYGDPEGERARERGCSTTGRRSAASPASTSRRSYCEGLREGIRRTTRQRPDRQRARRALRGARGAVSRASGRGRCRRAALGARPAGTRPRAGDRAAHRWLHEPSTGAPGAARRRRRGLPDPARPGARSQRHASAVRRSGAGPWTSCDSCAATRPASPPASIWEVSCRSRTSRSSSPSWPRA